MSLDDVMEGSPVWRVTLSGDLDLTSAPTVEGTLLGALDAGGRTILVDVRVVEFMDSSGLRALLSARSAIESEGGTLLLENCSPAVTRLLEISALLSGLTEPGQRLLAPADGDADEDRPADRADDRDASGDVSDEGAG